MALGSNEIMERWSCGVMKLEYWKDGILEWQSN